MTKIPFSPSEIKEPVMGRMGMEASIDFPITPLENFQAVMEGKTPMYMPTTSQTKMFCPRCIPDNVARGFVIDDGPAMAIEEFGGPDMFGTEWVYVPEVGGSMVRPGNPRMEDVYDWRSEVVMPDVDSWDWAGCAEQNKEFLSNPNVIYSTMLQSGFTFERLISFLEFENAAMAIIDEDQIDDVKEFCNEMMEKAYFPILENFAKYLPQVKIMILHDDWGSQMAPFFSLATARELFAPFFKRFREKCDSLGLIFELHSCGKNDKLVPAYIDGDVVMWNGMYINDKRNLFDQYGDKIILGVDPPLWKDKNGDVSQQNPYLTMKPDVTKEEMYALAKEFCEFFIRDGKCHCIANTMRANPYFVEGLHYYSRQMLCPQE